LLIRSIVIKGALLIFVFPVFAIAQELQSETAVLGEARRTATLTTMDTLDPKDFAKPPVVSKAEPAKKPSAVKKTGTDLAAEPAETSRAEVIGTVAQELSVMAPAAKTGTVSTGDAKLDELIAAAATRYRLDPRLIVAVMRQESSFNPRAVSPKGARGLMQLMPATAARFGVKDIHDPAQNIDGGARYLRFLLDNFNGNLELALAGYNAGENAVARYGNRIPPYRETMDYVQRISAHYNRLTGGAGMQMQPAVSHLTAASERRSEPELIGGLRVLAQY
jgi:hypothetical protein